MKTAKQDQIVMDLLKVKEISRIICDTNMGTLKLRIRKGETNYQFLLDAVELPKELHNELMEVIYPNPVAVLMSSVGVNPKVDTTLNPLSRKIYTPKIEETPNITPGKPKGRPKGSKNKVKDAGAK